jgi:hypothetical protein
MESCSIHEHEFMDNRYTHPGIDKKTNSLKLKATIKGADMLA